MWIHLWILIGIRLITTRLITGMIWHWPQVVHFEVSVHLWFDGKLFLAYMALKLLMAGVSPQLVLHEVVALGERQPAHRAHMVADFHVDGPDVALEEGHLLATHGTGARPVCRLQGRTQARVRMVSISQYSDVTGVEWCLNSPTTWLLDSLFKLTRKTPKLYWQFERGIHHWLVHSSTKVSNAKSALMSPQHHAKMLAEQ